MRGQKIKSRLAEAKQTLELSHSFVSKCLPQKSFAKQNFRGSKAVKFNGVDIECV